MEKSEAKQNVKKIVPKAGFLPEDAPNCHPEEMALRKQIRNKTKKLNNIAELEAKAAVDVGLELNAEQKDKISQKKAVRKEIDDIIKQIKEFQVKQAKIDEEFNAKCKDAIAAAVSDAVQNMANMLTMCTIANENSEAVPENLVEGVKKYNKSLKAVLNTNDAHADFNWSKSRDFYVKQWTKLVDGSNDELLSGLKGALVADGPLDKVIVSVHKPEAVAEPEVVEEVAATVEEPATQAEEEVKAEPAAEAEEPKADEQKDETVKPNFERRRGGGRGGRGRGRPLAEGEERPYRPRTGGPREGTDEDGFQMTNENGERRGGRGGRGRGFGRGRGRGYFGGEDGAGRGAGPRGPRGARRPRGGAPEEGAADAAPAESKAPETSTTAE